MKREDALGNPITETYMMTWPVQVPTTLRVQEEKKMWDPDSWEEDRLQDLPYKLKSVLVHDESSSCRHGHYWAFVWCTVTERWLRVDDHRVTGMPFGWSPDGVETGGKWANAAGQAGMVCAVFYERDDRETERDISVLNQNPDKMYDHFHNLLSEVTRRD